MPLMQEEKATRKALVLKPGEEILHIERMAELRSAVNMKMGKLVVTNQRIIYMFQKINMFGLIGKLMGMDKLIIVFDEPHSAVKGWSQGSHGPNKRVLELDLGKEKPIRFVLHRKYEETNADLKQLLGR